MKTGGKGAKHTGQLGNGAGYVGMLRPYAAAQNPTHAIGPILTVGRKGTDIWDQESDEAIRPYSGFKRSNWALSY